MAAGEFAAGLGLAGTDPFTGLAREDRPLSEALFVQNGTLDYELDERNRHRTVHHVDATVHLRLRAALGQIRSSPETGNGVPKIRYIDAQTPGRVVLLVTSALQDLIDNSDIALLEIQTNSTTVRGRIMVQVRYVNNRDPRGKRPRLATEVV